MEWANRVGINILNTFYFIDLRGTKKDYSCDLLSIRIFEIIDNSIPCSNHNKINAFMLF